MFRLISAIAVTSILACVSVPVVAQTQQAGVSAAVRGQVALARASESIVGRQVESGDPIFLGDAISSGKDSGMQVMLMDETVFTIGPNSEISIDEFVYDPETSAGKVTASVAKGVFRFITGKIAQRRPEDMTVRLPTATIGIRGTIVAGAVRPAVGADAQVDQLFDGIRDQIPDADAAKDFVVLLGPGDNNNTNDTGGAFVYTPRGAEAAERGRNAGSLLAQIFTGAGPGPGTTVSRTNSAVVSYQNGNVFGPFPSPPAVTQGFTTQFSAQPPAPGGDAADGDNSGTPPSQQAGPAGAESLGAGDVATLSGTTIADSGGDALTQQGQAGVAGGVEQISNATAGSGDAFSFADLRAIQTGTASINTSLALSNQFNISGFDVFIDLAGNFWEFNLTGISHIPTGLSAGTLVCTSGCSVDYSNLSGPAVVTHLDAAATTNCDNCQMIMAVTSAAAGTATVNISITHQGETGSGTATLN